MVQNILISLLKILNTILHGWRHCKVLLRSENKSMTEKYIVNNAFNMYVYKGGVEGPACPASAVPLLKVLRPHRTTFSCTRALVSHACSFKRSEFSDLDMHNYYHR